MISGHTETKKLSTLSIHYDLHKNTYTIITLHNLQQYLQNTKMNVVRVHLIKVTIYYFITREFKGNKF